ncbi:hypothetical protein, partial [Bacillus litorisediminis]|uniref:hypothetical protein n=1 Tax=Bacillus litorisediminis TaxID=2922713 RepID=UPI001FB03DF4
VSESSMYSDRFTLFKASRVRIKHVFGQVYSFQSQPCPNQACIRTGLLFSKPVVSESSGYSDRFTLFKASRVRIKHVFGQIYSFQSQSCPNQARIRTGLLNSRSGVSESSGIRTDLHNLGTGVHTDSSSAICGKTGIFQWSLVPLFVPNRAIFV